MIVSRTSTASKPAALPVIIEGIPAKLRALNQWVTWKYVEEIDTKTGTVDYDKPPLCARGGPASSTNPRTWSPFDAALTAYKKDGLDGIGFVLGAKKEGKTGAVMVGVDLDHCRDKTTGDIEPWAAKIIKQLDSYTESSPSGEGIRVFLRGKLPPHGRKRSNFEVYCSGRYVTVTGQHIAGTPMTIESREEEIEAVHKQIWPELQEKKKPSMRSLPAANLTDLKLIERAKKAKNGVKFSALWNGDTSGFSSQSEADLALCSYLAFWSGPNSFERIDGLFRQSGLFRSKWNREDYRTRTIRKALEDRSEYYTRKGHQKHEMNGYRKEPSVASNKFCLGPFVLLPGTPRQTASGKISLSVNVEREGKIVYPFVLTNAASGRKEPLRVLKQLLGSGIAAADGDAVLTRLLAFAAENLANRKTPDSPTVRQIVADKVPEALQLVCRMARGAWSESRGAEISRADFVTFVPGWLVEECSAASDAPKDASGRPLRSDLIRLIQLELSVLWSDLLSTLPAEADADLTENTEKGRAFHQAVVHLWKVPVTWEKQQTATGDSATRASLVSRVISKQKQADAEQIGRSKWNHVHSACDAWWRRWVDPEGESLPLLAMRWTLGRQVGIELPGVRDEESLTRLGMQFGVLQKPPPGVPSRLSGGTHRLAVLSLDLCRELLEMPCEDAEDNPREPGT